MSVLQSASRMICSLMSCTRYKFTICLLASPHSMKTSLGISSFSSFLSWLPLCFSDRAIRQLQLLPCFQFHTWQILTYFLREVRVIFHLFFSCHSSRSTKSALSVVLSILSRVPPAKFIPCLAEYLPDGNFQVDESSLHESHDLSFVFCIV